MTDSEIEAVSDSVRARLKTEVLQDTGDVFYIDEFDHFAFRKRLSCSSDSNTASIVESLVAEAKDAIVLRSGSRPIVLRRVALGLNGFIIRWSHRKRKENSPMTPTEDAWRCQTDGAFHVLDLSTERQDACDFVATCTKCEALIKTELLASGMANAVNEPKKATAPTTVNRFRLNEPDQMRYISIGNPGEPLIRIYLDGRLEYGPNYTPDAAAKLFWQAIAGHAPYTKTT